MGGGSSWWAALVAGALAWFAGWDWWVAAALKLKCLEGIWMALQGAGTPVAVAVAVLYPWWKERSSNFDLLIAHRNAAKYVERYITGHHPPDPPSVGLAQQCIAGTWINPLHTQAFQVCLDELKRLDRTTGIPARLGEKLFHVAVQGTVFLQYLPPVGAPVLVYSATTRQRTPDEVSHIQSLSQDMQQTMESVDKYLRQRGARFAGSGLAYRP